jgi:AGCS family alanine or glycine:cation symporter
MDLNALTRDVELLWIAVAAPLVLVATIVLSVRLRAPQVLQLREAFRALRAHDPTASGTVPPATSVVLSAVATYGAAGAVGAATAVSLGGAGAIAWVWLFTLLLAPLRVGEALLARTAPPGQAGARTGSLAGRLMAEPGGGLRALGWALLVLVPLVGLAFYGGVHGQAVADASERLLPGSALTVGLVVAAAGALFALVPLQRGGSILGWIGLVALVTLFGAACVAFFSEPGRAFGGFGRAILDAIYDAPSTAAFSGATAGEIAYAAMLHVLPPIAATTGVDGALHAEAQATTTRRQAASALLAPLVFGVITTVLGLALVATGAFARPVEDHRSIAELRSYSVGFDTVSQREEADRRFTGILRISEGSIGPIANELATERGMVVAPRFVDRGEPADVMLRYRDGQVQELQRRGTLGVLERAPLEDVGQIEVHGRMLPRGGLLLAETMGHAGGSVLARIALAALLVLAALGAAAWGAGIARTLRAKLSPAVARWTALLPAVGLALAALGVVPWLGLLGSALAGVLTIVSVLALVLRAGQAGQLLKK